MRVLAWVVLVLLLAGATVVLVVPRLLFDGPRSAPRDLEVVTAPAHGVPPDDVPRVGGMEDAARSPVIAPMRAVRIAFVPGVRLAQPATLTLSADGRATTVTTRGEPVDVELPIGPIVLRVHGPRMDETIESLEVPDGAGAWTHVHAWRPLDRITGHVFDETTGRPVEAFEASVTTRCLADGVPLLERAVVAEFSSEEGRFGFGAVQALGCVGEASVAVRAPGYVEWIGPWRQLGVPVVSDELVVLARLAELIGRVRDASTRLPVEGARVQVVAEGVEPARVWYDEDLPFGDIEPRGESTLTSMRGTFALDAIAEGGALLITHRDYRTAIVPLTDGPGRAPLEIELGRGAEIGVRVLGVDLTGVRVQLRRPPDDAAPSLRWRTPDAEGAARFAGLAPGAWDVSAVRVAGSGLLRLGGRLVEVGELASVQVTLDLAKGARILGRLIPPLAAGALDVMAALVLGGRSPGVSAQVADGRFELLGVPEGEHVVLVQGASPSGGEALCGLVPLVVGSDGELAITIDLRGRDLRLELPPSGRPVRIAIRSARTGDARVDAILASLHVYASAEGVCVVGGLPPGDYELAWTSADGEARTLAVPVVQGPPGHVAVHRVHDG